MFGFKAIKEEELKDECDFDYEKLMNDFDPLKIKTSTAEQVPTAVTPRLSQSGSRNIVKYFGNG